MGKATSIEREPTSESDEEELEEQKENEAPILNDEQ